MGKTPPFCVGGRLRLPDGEYSALLSVKGGEVTTGKITDPLRWRAEGFSREMLPDTRFDVLFDDGVFVPGSGTE
jgi:hypothetical protein